jgi:hypothetical protein
MKNLPPGTNIAKTVEWAYPTSDCAKNFGFERTGCWTVQRSYSHPEVSVPPEAIAGFKTREEALAAARLIDLPWTWMFVRLHPTDAKVAAA